MVVIDESGLEQIHQKGSSSMLELDVIVLPPVLPEPAVDDDATPLFQVLVAVLCELSPGGDVDVADLLLQLVVPVVVAVVGNGERAQRGPALYVAKLGI
jgi:hypothetical protein